jgi:hypothetical protein
MEGEVAIISVLADAWEVEVRDSQCQWHLNNEVFFTILSEDERWIVRGFCQRRSAENKKNKLLTKGCWSFPLMLHEEA